jgi:pepF/M3 family oligoendopeptidase
MTTATQPIVWDLTPFFPSLDSPEFHAAVTDLKATLDALEIRTESLDATASADDVAQVIEAQNGLTKKAKLVLGYLNLLLTTNTQDEAAQAARSGLMPTVTKMSQVQTKITNWIGELPAKTLESANEVVAAHAFPLSRTKIRATHLMPMAEEHLASEMVETGSTAWEKLYDDVSSTISTTHNGQDVTMSGLRAMAYDSDPAVRKSAYEKELETWKTVEIPIAAALNAIKGEANALATRRGWVCLLDITLFHCNMGHGALEAMMSAAQESFPDWRRYLRAKAKLLGHQGGLPFYDIFAPIGGTKVWSWEEGENFVEEGFGSYSEKLGKFARRSFDEAWHDVDPRPGKVDGAFCAGIRGDESRMLHNFKASFNSVSTLAHELGHAYHNVCLAERTPMQKSTPMTLAETASIFCETIIKRRALAETSGDERLGILEASLQGACQVVVDITSRYRFESEVVNRRRERELSARELCEIMREAQLSTYGDGLDENALHPYMWAAKPHYYSTFSFYNFPYMFGLLFALGLYRVYQEKPEGFHEAYDALLSRTGMSMASELTAEFGIDINDINFWRGSLAVLKDDIEQFVSEVENR